MRHLTLNQWRQFTEMGGGGGLFFSKSGGNDNFIVSLDFSKEK